MPQDINPIQPAQSIAASLRPMTAALSTSMVDDAELQGFIDLLREPFNIGDWNDRDPRLVLFLRSIHLKDEENEA